MAKRETLIIGAGPAGLAAAMKLSESKKDFLVVEKGNQVGGLAKTYEFREGDLVFRADNGPHRFFSKNQELYRFMEGLLKEQWIEVKRQTRQFIDGKFYDYPVRPIQALANIGPKKAAKMVADYAAARFQYGLMGREVKNFEDYVVANFGRGLGNFNMINYTEKIWGVPASTIHTDWAVQRIKGLSIGVLIKAAIRGIIKPFKTEKLRTLADVFYYPEYGTGLIYNKIQEKLEREDYEIIFNAYPVNVRHSGGRINDVFLNNGETIEIDNLIESVPIKEFLNLLDPLPPRGVLEANEKIKYRDQVYLFITLNKDKVTDDQWIYFPQKHLPFGRISEMKNFSQKMSPVGKTSLFVEFFCFKDDEIWNKTKEELLDIVTGHLEPLGFFKKEEVRNCYLIKQEKVYPIYDTNYKEYLSVIKDYLNQFSNLYYIGRPGRFRYNNQDHSLEMGFLAARSIIDGIRYDIEQVGGESEYFEKGNIQTIH